MNVSLHIKLPFDVAARLSEVLKKLQKLHNSQTKPDDRKVLTMQALVRAILVVGATELPEKLLAAMESDSIRVGRPSGTRAA